MHAFPRFTWLPLVLPLLANCRVEEGGARAAAPQSTSATQVAAAFDQTHAAWTKLLEAHVKAMRVDYAGMQKDAPALDAYLKELESVQTLAYTQWKTSEQLAFWINAYNAFTVKRVLRSYPFERVDQLGPEKKGPWDEAFIPLGHLWSGTKQKDITLNDIEHRIIRPLFKDARVHAALNCAAASCPPLLEQAYRADRLEAQLLTRVWGWMQSTKLNRFDAGTKTLQVSKLFEWYAQDFVDAAGSVPAWIAKHGGLADSAWLTGADVKLTYLEYSWTLNDVPRKK